MIFTFSDGHSIVKRPGQKLVGMRHRSFRPVTVTFNQNDLDVIFSETNLGIKYLEMVRYSLRYIPNEAPYL